MDQDSEELKQMLSAFPRLKTDSFFTVTSCASSVYNCVAWAMGLSDRWVSPNPAFAPGIWWPQCVNRSSSIESLIEAFECMGFCECADDLPETGFDKVALYKNPKNNEWTHAARVLSENVYHSKIGSNCDIHHGKQSFNETQYGKICVYMKRATSDRRISEELMNEAEGEIEIS